MSLSLIVEQLLSEVKRENQAGPLSDELLSALQAVFGTPLLHALAIIDVEGSVTLYSCPAGRRLYQVSSSNRGNKYCCLLSSNYCSCPSFIYNVVLKQEWLLCKHQLAVHLSTAMDHFNTVQVTDKEFTKLLSENETIKE